jgi:catechol 2,3-dioxygenase-like lactoylglutathione lyase family enzyme
MSETGRVQRLQHVSVPRPPGSADQARRFYGDLLGLEELPLPASLAHLDLVWYRLGDDELHLFADERGGHPAQHFCLQLDTLEGLRQRLLAAGVSIGAEPDIPNRPRFTFHDPFGNLIEATTILGQYE